MDFQFSEPHLRFGKPISIMLLIGIALVVTAWFVFERNACALESFIRTTGRMLSIQPDIACRMLSFTY